MARILDTERIKRLLESEGGSVGRREIMEALGFSDERYEQLADQLVSSKEAAKNRGRGGGLRLASFNGQDEKARPSRAEAESSLPPLEKALYPAFAKYLVDAAKKEGKSTVLRTHETRLGKWETPDLAEVRVTPFPMVGQWELRVAVYELKRQDSCSVESVLQAATYGDFAHESWLVIPATPEGDWTEDFGKRVVDKAGDLGIGLATFDPDDKVLKKHMTPQRRVPPSLARQQEWLEWVLDRLGDAKLKEEIAGHVRWARDKAGSGRD